MVQLVDIEEVKENLGKKVRSTSKTTWKKFELKVAKDFGTNRTPLSGMVKSLTNSDTLHPELYIECKYRGEDYPFWEEFENRRKTDTANINVFSINPKNRAEVHLYYYADFFKRISGFKRIKITGSNKYRGVSTLFEQTIERSIIESKIPIIAIKKKGCDGYLIGIAPKDFFNIQKILRNNVKRGITSRESNRRR